VPNRGFELFKQKVDRFSIEMGLYARVLPVVQSTGAGKSRLVDEMAKTVFTFPLYLRQHGEAGQPSRVCHLSRSSLPFAQVSLEGTVQSDCCFARNGRSFTRPAFFTTSSSISFNRRLT
jgi:hypothetical protein